MKQRGIIVDIDGTLSDPTHRRHFMEGKKDWKSFYDNMALDTPNQWCHYLVGKFVCDNAIILVSGRPDDYRKTTEEWLSKFGIPKTELFMRKSGDFREDYIIKKEIYNSNIEPFYDIFFCVDDRKQVVDMWRSLGLTCLQCADGNF